MIDSLKDLERLLKLCRKQGVTKITLNAVAFELGELPTKIQSQSIDDIETEQESLFDAPLAPAEYAALANGDYGSLSEN